MPTKIEWCEETWSPVVGCSKCSPGCDNCYAEQMAYRLMAMEKGRLENQLGGKYSHVVGRIGGWTGKIYCDESALEIPLHWKKPRRIFVVSMGDLFHPKVPFEFINRIFNIMALPDRHTFLLLTKRIKKASEYFQYKKEMTESLNKQFEDDGVEEKCIWPWPNVWLGVSVSNQAEADEKIPILLQIPAAKRWVSIESMLEGINLCTPHWNRYLQTNGTGRERIDWVVLGCESGPKRRPCKLEWMIDIVNQCKAADVPVFVKQVSINGKVSHDPKEWPEELRVREWPQRLTKGR